MILRNKKITARQLSTKSFIFLTSILIGFSGCSNVNSPKNPIGIDTTLNKEKQKIDTKFDGISYLTDGQKQTLNLKYFYTVSGPNPKNKFSSASYLILLEKSETLDLSDPELLGKYLNKLGRGVRVDWIEGEIRFSANYGNGWNELKPSQDQTLFKLPNSLSAARDGSKSFELDQNFRFLDNLWQVHISLATIPIESFILEVPRRPELKAIGKNQSIDESEAKKFYIAYCERNMQIARSVPAFSTYLKSIGQYPTTQNLNLIRKNFGTVTTIPELVKKTLHAAQQRLSEFPRECRIKNSMVEGQLVRLEIDAEVESKRVQFEAYLKQIKKSWQIVDQSIWMPQEK